MLDEFRSVTTARHTVSVGPFVPLEDGQTSGEVPLPRRDERARHVRSGRAYRWGARPAAPTITPERFGHLDSRPNVVGFSRRVKNDCTLTFGAATFGRLAIPHGHSTAGTHPRAPLDSELAATLTVEYVQSLT